MDFPTQVILGAAAGQAAGHRSLGRWAAVAGGLGGALPDLDVLLRPLSDPALPYELHRHFTHALAFVPVGGVLAAAPLLLVPSLRARWRAVLAIATVGCLTHGLLDNLTSYGTHLLWPFVPHRTSWDAMPIVDPFFTGVLLVGLVAALALRRARPALAALALALAYVGVGFAQHARAIGAVRTLATARGHEIERVRVMPTLANLVLWRSVYEVDGRIHADAVRVPFGGAPLVRVGESLPVFDADAVPERADARARFARFDAFATGFVAVAPGSPPDRPLVGDMRISIDAAGFDPLWGLRIDPAADDPLAWSAPRRERSRDRLGALLDEILAPDDRYVALDRAVLEARADAAPAGGSLPRPGA